MSMDSLVLYPMDKWQEIQDVFKASWPQGIPVYWILETYKFWATKGIENSFSVYCPYGQPSSGMVALNEKGNFYEVLIQCPNNDINKLEQALLETSRIDWSRRIIAPFTSDHLVNMLRRLFEKVGMEEELINPSHGFFIDKKFENVKLPQGVTFGPITSEYVTLINDKWPHRYPGSEKYYQQLIKYNFGLGLFKNNKLISWCFVVESGALSHLFTLENERRNGYGSIMLRLICNHQIENCRDAFAFCVKRNTNACKLYKKLGFKSFNDISWCYFKPKINII